jgi:hypothetical protein
MLTESFESTVADKMNAAEIVRNANKIRCVTYKDDFSANKCSYDDMMIGVNSGVVGCNSGVFGSSSSGDIVIITSNKGKEKYFIVGVLRNQLHNCDAWKHEGGFAWDHNFEYTPLSKIVFITNELKAEMVKICLNHNVDDKYLLHSRFCGIRYKPVLIDMFALNII